MNEKGTGGLNVLYVIGDRGLDLTKLEGYTIHVQGILDGLRNKAHRTFLIAISDAARLNGFGEGLCVPHRYARLVHRVLPYFGLLDSFNVARACRRANRAARFDVIHERLGLYSYGGWWTARSLGLPYVMEVNAPLVEEKALAGYPLSPTQRLSARLSTAFCLRQADQIVSVSSSLKDYLVARLGIDEAVITVLPNAADTDAFGLDCERENVRALLDLSNKTVIGFVGALHVWYGIENLLVAFDQVRRQRPDAFLLLVGDGQARPDLEHLSAKLGLGQAVRLLGKVEHTRIPPLLSAMDIAVAPFRHLPTGFYASPIKVFEYMAAGKAIVASRIGQVAEVLRHERDALLVKPGDAQELSQAILRLADDPQLRKNIGSAARAQARAKYSWDVYAGRLVEVYQKAIKRSKHT